MSETTKIFTVRTYQSVTCDAVLSLLCLLPQPEDSSSSSKNEANRTSGGSGGLMEEMNALLARRSEHWVEAKRIFHGCPAATTEQD